MRARIATMGLGKDQKAELSSEVLFQEIRGESVLLDLSSENYFGLDAVGTRVWQLLAEGVEVGGVLEVLKAEYDADAGTLESDLQRLLGELAEAGLITLAEARD